MGKLNGTTASPILYKKQTRASKLCGQYVQTETNRRWPGLQGAGLLEGALFGTQVTSSSWLSLLVTMPGLQAQHGKVLSQEMSQIPSALLGAKYYDTVFSVNHNEQCSSNFILSHMQNPLLWISVPFTCSQEASCTAHPGRCVARHVEVIYITS